MAKVVISRINPITILGNSFLIYDHDVIDGKIYYKFRVNLVVNDSNAALKDNFEIRLTRESPFSNRPNMFKNQNIGTNAEFLNKIKNYDKNRIDVFRKRITIVKKIPIIYQDLKSGFIEFTVKDPGTQVFYATLTKVNDTVAHNQQIVNINNDVLISRYSIPKSDFIIGTGKVFRNTARISITPKDKRISKFKVLVQDVYGNTNADNPKSTKYIAQVTSEGIANIDIPDTGSVTRKIRVTPISYYRNAENGQYKEVIINEQKKYNDKCIIYPSKFTGSIASFTIRSIPDDVIYVKLLRKNLTRMDKDATFIAGAAIDFEANNVILQDVSIVPYNTFLYYALFEFKDGTQRNSSGFYVLSPKFLQANISLNVSNESFNETATSVTRKFNAAVEYKSQTSTQSLLNDLKELGIDNIFPNEIKNLSTQLDPLIGILVTRIDLIDCSEVRLGIFKPGLIEDTFRKDIQCVYTFEIVIKPAIEIIEDISSSRDFSTVFKVDNIGDPMIASRALGLSNFQKKTNFTQKFFNKSALYYGNLKYGKALSTLDAGIESGRTSIFKNIVCTQTLENPVINTIVSTVRDQDKILTWTSTGNEYVSDFVIIDASQGKSTILGKINADPTQSGYTSLVPIGVTRVKIQANLIRGQGTSFEADI
jgi:hypothetical protein